MGFNFLAGFIWKGQIDVFSLRQVLVLTIFALDVAMAKLIFSKFSFKWLFLLVLCLTNLFYHITLKSAIVGFLLSFALMLFIKMKDRGLARAKIIVVIFCVAGFSYTLFVYGTDFLPKKLMYQISFKDQVARTIAWRYFKSEVSLAEDFDLATISRSEGDISSNRFRIWKAYLILSLKNFGVAPQGFGHGGIFGVKIDETGHVQGAHNLFFFFAFNSGLIAALLFLALIVRYIYLNILVLSSLKPGIYGRFTREELIALFSFSVTILGISMFEGSIHNLHVASIFWFSVAVLLKRYDALHSNVATSNSFRSCLSTPGKAGEVSSFQLVHSVKPKMKSGDSHY